MKRLRLSKLNEVSLVDAGDNPKAHVVIHKRIATESAPAAGAAPTATADAIRTLAREDGAVIRAIKAIGKTLGWEPEQVVKMPGGEVMTFDQVQAQDDAWDATDEITEYAYSLATAIRTAVAAGDAKAAEASVEQFAARVKGELPQFFAKAENEGAHEAPAAEPATAKNEEQGTMAEQTATQTQEQVDKVRQLEEELAKLRTQAERTEQLEKQLATAVEKAEMVEYIGKAKALPGVPGEAADVAKMLRAIDKQLPAEIAKQVNDAFAAMSKQLQEGALLTEVGKQGAADTEDSAQGEVLKRARAMVTEGKASDIGKAIEATLTADPALAQRYTDEARGR